MKVCVGTGVKCVSRPQVVSGSGVDELPGRSQIAPPPSPAELEEREGKLKKCHL